jgi:hypothetical protein
MINKRLTIEEQEGTKKHHEGKIIYIQPEYF